MSLSPLTSYNSKSRVGNQENKITNLTNKIFFVVPILLVILINFFIFENWFFRPKFEVKPLPILQNPTLIPTQKEEKASITLIFTGDVIPARSVNSAMVGKNDFKFPFEKTSDFLVDADATIINLEAPLMKNCPVTDTGMIFCGDERFTEGLEFAGVDVANLANNHSSNYGLEGINSTIAILKGKNIGITGAGSIYYQNIKGVRFAFIGYNGISPLVEYLQTINKEEIQKNILEAKSNADFVVVMFHWGKEYSPIPQSDGEVAPFDPVEIGRFTIDGGADLVLGNHPYVIQGYEDYKGKMIFYALGNFIFDQMWSEETRLGTILKVNLIDNKVESFTFHPVKIYDYSQPIFLEGEEENTVLDYIDNLSEKN